MAHKIQKLLESIYLGRVKPEFYDIIDELAATIGMLEDMNGQTETVGEDLRETLKMWRDEISEQSKEMALDLEGEIRDQKEKFYESKE